MCKPNNITFEIPEIDKSKKKIIRTARINADDMTTGALTHARLECGAPAHARFTIYRGFGSEALTFVVDAPTPADVEFRWEEEVDRIIE